MACKASRIFNNKTYDLLVRKHHILVLGFWRDTISSHNAMKYKKLVFSI